MKTPCLAPHLLAATLLAAAGSPHADPLHGSARLPDAMVGYASTLSSDPFVARTSHLSGGLMPSRTRIDVRADVHGAPMLGLLGHERAQLRDDVGRVRSMPRVSLGTMPQASSPRF